MRNTLILTAASLALALSACDGGSTEPSGDERGSAAGEVLGGTVSDAMIPLDELRSTSPIEATAPSTGPGQAPTSAGDSVTDRETAADTSPPEDGAPTEGDPAEE